MKKLAIFSFLLVLLLQSISLAAVYTVDTTNDLGIGNTLRNQLAAAAATPGTHDTIVFNIPRTDHNYTPAGWGSYFVITLQSTLGPLQLHNLLFIDGASQGQNVPDNNPLGPEIVIDATNIAAGRGAFESLAQEDWILSGINIINSNATDSSAIWIDADSRNNYVYGCYIGTSPSGESLGSSINTRGVFVEGVNNVIGSSESDYDRNIISGNSYGIYLSGSSAIGNRIISNYIGTNREGTSAVPNTSFAIYLDNQANENYIGDGTANGGNIISGNRDDGIRISNNSNGNIILGNYIGLSQGGSTSLANDLNGIYIDSSNLNQIGSHSASSRNYIAGNSQYNIIISNGSISNEVINNYIGCDATGSFALSTSSHGIVIDSSSLTKVGDGGQNGGNLISGNQVGVYINSSQSTEVLGNYIGTDYSATSPLANSSYGILLSGGSNNIIGQVGENMSNIISANGNSGITFNGSNHNWVVGNYIGTNVDGATTLGNTKDGINISNSSVGNQILENVISGNTLNGVNILSSSSYNNILGNKIGANSEGNAAIPNGSNGVIMNQASFLNNIGSGSPDGRNIISGNSLNGIWIFGTGTNSNEINDNYIGLNNAGTSALGNGLSAIKITKEAYNSSIKYCQVYGAGIAAITLDQDNTTTIQYNTIEAQGSGILSEDQSTSPTIYQNTIFGHGSGVGIDLGSSSSSGRTIVDGLINYNEIRNFATGLYVGLDSSYALQIDHNTIVDNTNGIICNPNTFGNIVVNNSILSGDTSGYGIKNIGQREVEIKYSDLYNFANSYVSVTPGTGMISQDAQFVDANNNDYHLKSSSPAIDAGDPSSSADPDGSRTDMGRYPYTHNSSSPPNVYIISPNGGESWLMGSSQTITWVATKPGATINDIDLWYSVDNGSNYTSLATNLSNSGSYTWNPIPSLLTNNALVKVRATDTNGYYASDESDSVFTIRENIAPVVTIEAPTGGETLEAGNNLEILWQATDNFTAIGDLKVFLDFSRDQGNTWQAIDTNQPNSPPYSFTVPFINTTEARIRIRVSDEATNIGSDESGNFTIQTISPEVVIYEPQIYPPSTNKVIPGNQNFLIEWGLFYSLRPITISLEASFNGGASWSHITVETTSSTNVNFDYLWAVPDVNTNEAEIKVIATYAPSLAGYAISSKFTIDSQGPQITVLNPSGGEVVGGGNNLSLSWEAVDNFTPQQDIDIQLEYSLDSGTTFTPFATNESNDGSYPNWPVPYANTTGAVIQVVGLDNVGNFSNQNSNSFTITTTGPAVQLLKPIGMEYFQGGTTEEITWTATSSNAPVSLNIRYSLNRGRDWFLITTGESNSGSYSWLTPAVNTNEAMISLEATDAIGLKGYDSTTNLYFTIDSISPEISLLNPNGGESLTSGDIYYLSWEATDNLSPITINFLYSLDNGISWNMFLSNIANNSPYTSWTVPAINNNNVLISIEAIDAAGNSNFDSSDSPFSITTGGKPTVEVVQPNGGENILGGSSYQIVWTAFSSFEPFSVNLQYSLNDGNSWTTIDSVSQSTSGQDNYSWSVPEINTSESKVKVVVTDSNNQISSDQSDLKFSIYTNELLLNLIQPTTGEVVQAGSPYDIAWLATSSAEPIAISLYYSLNGGSSWVEITPETSNTSTYSWDVPSVDTNQARVYVGAVDNLGRSAQDFGGNFTISTSSGGPEILVKVNNKTLYSGSYIPSTPPFVATITDTVSIAASSINLNLEGNNLAIQNLISNNDFTSIEARHTIASALSAGTYSLTVEASNILGHSSTKTYNNLRVATGTEVGYLIFNPIPWNPSQQGSGKMAFTINRDQDLVLMLYSVGGQIIWQHNYSATAGYNEIEFSGNLPNGSRIANGAYILGLVSKSSNKRLAKAYIVVNE